MNYDVTGDVPAQSGKLEALLRDLGYRESDRVWRCPDRTAIFVSDLIDRAPAQLQTLDLVRRMIDAGTADCIMGNHEFNAIAWMIPDPDQPGEFLRPHGKPGNRQQHQAFLDAVGDKVEHDMWIQWFKTLPLWRDLGGLRVVHACWHEPSMDELRSHLSPQGMLSDELFALGNRDERAAHAAIEILCKGPELQLPLGMEIQDKDGKRRTAVRIRWWASDLSTYWKAAIGPAGEIESLPDLPLPDGARDWRTLGPPAIFGHYWFRGMPQVISPRFAYVDYSAAAVGPLVAYRWDGEPELESDKLAWV